MNGGELAAKFAFLGGGGDMGGRIRAHDWAATPLGAPDRWPAPLRAALSICLNSSFPTAIYWGPELRVLYNDAWAPIAGERHPWALGRPAREVWSDIWHVIGPQFEQVRGTATGFSAFDQLLPMKRAGHAVESYWNYSFTPILDETGAVAGVFNQGNETTAVVLGRRERDEETERLRAMFKQAPSAIAVLRGPEHVFEITNDAYRRLIGQRDVIGRSVAEALPEVIGQGFLELLDRVYQSGEPFIGASAPINLEYEGNSEERLLDFLYQPIKDSSGRVTGIFVEATDATERARAEAALRESEERFRLVAESAPVMLWMGDENGKCVYFNKAQREFWGVTMDDISTFDWNITLYPDDRDKLFEPFARGMRTQSAFSVEARYRRTDGQYRILHTEAQPRFGQHGQFLGMIGVNEDVTETRKSEARRNALLELADRVRDLTDPGDIAYAASEILGRTLGVSRAGYGTIDRAAETITIERDWNAPGIKSLAGVLHFRDYGSYIEDLKRGETVVFADAEKDPRTAATADALKAITAQSVVNMPVTEFGNFVALLFLNHATPREWPMDELAFIRDVAERTRSIVERRRAEQDLQELTVSLERQVEARTDELRANITRLRTTFETSFIYQGYLTRDGTVLDSNAASLAGIDATLEDVVGKPFWDTPWFTGTPGMPEVVREAVELVATGEPIQQSIALDLPTGRHVFDFSLRPVKNERGDVVAMIPEAVETTDRIKAEEALRQAQKMEAVGQLTGGIAHDFNNMMAVVIGALNLLQRRLSQGNTNVTRYIDAALEGASRAASLTQRLLAFSRQQALAPEPIDANRLISGMTELLTRTLGEQIRIETAMAPDLWTTYADPVQLESAIINLSVNARDAMPQGGTLTIESSNLDLQELHAPALQVPKGQYVVIAVTDTGTGMTSDVKAQAFDPFFTTKRVGEGTGLGLSQVFGFVSQSGGHVQLDSEPSAGTTVKIYLPRYVGDAAPRPPKREPMAAARGDAGEIILVVEDELRVRNYSVEALRELGYSVLSAANGPEAIKMIDAGQDITLLFTDVVMPDMTGRQLADYALEKLPKLKVLFTTGYTRDAIVRNAVLDPGTNVLTKPFDIEQLAAKVRSVLDS